jgi:hypothetical protein
METYHGKKINSSLICGSWAFFWNPGLQGTGHQVPVWGNRMGSTKKQLAGFQPSASAIPFIGLDFALHNGM